MKNKFDGETATRLAGLQIDLLQNLRAGQTSLEEFEMFLNMKPAKRKQMFGVNPWADQMSAISKFYKDELDITVDWSKIVLPAYTDERPRLELRLAILTCNDLVQKYGKKFGNLAGNDYSQKPDGAIHIQQDRPSGDYAFAWNGTIEPDTEHLNKSYNMFKDGVNKYMVPIEGIIAAYRYRCETGDMLDVMGITRFHAVDSHGYVLYMRRDGDGRFRVGFGRPDGQNSDRGPRQIKIS